VFQFLEAKWLSTLKMDSVVRDSHVRDVFGGLIHEHLKPIILPRNYPFTVTTDTAPHVLLLERQKAVFDNCQIK